MSTTNDNKLVSEQLQSVVSFLTESNEANGPALSFKKYLLTYLGVTEETYLDEINAVVEDMVERLSDLVLEAEQLEEITPRPGTFVPPTNVLPQEDALSLDTDADVVTWVQNLGEVPLEHEDFINMLFGE